MRVLKLKPLTEEQQRLAESCHRYAYYIAKRIHKQFPLICPEEINGFAVNGLVYAASLFDPSRGTKFTTYCGVAIPRYVFQRCKRLNKSKSLWHQYYSDELEAVLSENLTSRDPSAESLLDQKCVWEDIKQALPKRLYKILKARFIHGLTLQEISERLGVCKERVRQLEAMALRKAKEHFEGKTN